MPEDGKPAIARPRRALLVLGMHRSGTSAVTRVLSLCGASLPKHLIPANRRNPRGFFESEVVFRLHDALLDQLGRTWRDLSPLPDGWFDSDAALPWIERLVEAVEGEFGDSEFFVLKDPRLCRLVPLWRRALSRLEVEPLYVIPVRDPLEVAQSLQGSEGLPPQVGHLLWLDYFLCAERDTRGAPRSFVHYSGLITDWRREVDRIEGDLGIRLPRRSRSAEAEVDDFLTADLRRQHAGASELFEHSDAHAWVRDVYRWVCDAADGAPGDVQILDAVRETLARAEAAFGPALAGLEHRLLERERALGELEGRMDALRAELEEEEAVRRDLRERLAGEREQNARLTQTLRWMFRWVVDRVRKEGPAPASLQPVLRAMAEGRPEDLPAIAETGLLLAEQRVEIERLEREIAARAAEIERLALQAERGEGARKDLDRSSRDAERERDALREVASRLRTERSEGLAALRSATAAARQEEARRRCLEQERADLLVETEGLRSRVAELEQSLTQRRAKSRFWRRLR